MKALEIIQLSISLAISTPVLHAADGLAIEQGIPLEMSDAYPMDHLAREFHLFGRYENSSEEGDFWSLVSRFEYGLARHWEISVELPLETGSATANGIGNLKMEAIYQLLSNEDIFPAVSLVGALSLPTGKGSRGWDPTLGILTTQKLEFTPQDDRLHLNFSFYHNAKAGDQRDNSFKFLIGYDLRITDHTILLADFVREQESDRKTTSNVLEFGVCTTLQPQTVVGAGFGVGLNDESPDIRLTVGMQRAF